MGQHFNLCNGDMLLVKGADWESEIIEAASGSDYSHVAIVAWATFGTNSYCGVIEACIKGVRWMPLDLWLRQLTEANNEAHHFALAPNLDGDAVVRFAAQQIGKPYAHWFRQFSLSFGFVSRYFHRLFTGRTGVIDCDRDRWFCSELATAALRAAGWHETTGENRIAAAVDPGHVATFNCLSWNGRLDFEISLPADDAAGSDDDPFLPS